MTQSFSGLNRPRFPRGGAELRHRKSAQGTRKSETHSRSQGNSLKFSSRQRAPLSTYGFEGLAFPATPTQYMPK